MLLTGTFHRSIDEKQRIALPKSVRDAVAAGASSLVFYLTPGTDGSICLYAEDSFEKLATRLAEASPVSGDVRAFGRLFYANARRVELDRQGRLRVPQELVDLASLGGEIVLVGVGDHLELWEATRWRTYLEAQQNQYDQLAESAFGESIKPR
ncbi:MAG: division/cell wall cluster transcriptional repressor MraZ [Planctomycetota bacterium]|nr:MAG: division/cell wall cluster transcriptional repressor MraZ [Planctomycetota bacterium]